MLGDGWGGGGSLVVRRPSHVTSRGKGNSLMMVLDENRNVTVREFFFLR